MMGLVAGLYIW